MKFKEFYKWCNERACDACWGMREAVICVGVMEDMKKVPFWKREKIWKERYEDEIVYSIVNPTNELIEKYKGA